MINIIGVLLIFGSLVLGILFWAVQKAKTLMIATLEDRDKAIPFVVQLRSAGFLDKKLDEFTQLKATANTIFRHGGGYADIIDIDFKRSKKAFNVPAVILALFLFAILVLEVSYLPEWAFFTSLALLFLCYLAPLPSPGVRRALNYAAIVCWLMYDFNKTQPGECQKFVERIKQFKNLHAAVSTEEEIPKTVSQAPEVIVGSQPSASSMQPIFDLVTGIVSASWYCTQEVRSHLQINPEFDKPPHTPVEQDIYIFFEFLYFFMHLLNRAAHPRLTIANLEKLQLAVSSFIFPSVVGAFFGHWPENLKGGIRSDLYTKLNDAETEYASCNKLRDENPHLSGQIDQNALLSRLAKNVLAVAGYDVERPQIDTETRVVADVVEVSAATKIAPASAKAVDTPSFRFGSLNDLSDLVERSSAAISLLETNGGSLAKILNDYLPEAARELGALIRTTMPQPSS